MTRYALIGTAISIMLFFGINEIIGPFSAITIVTTGAVLIFIGIAIFFCQVLKHLHLTRDDFEQLQTKKKYLLTFPIGMMWAGMFLMAFPLMKLIH